MLKWLRKKLKQWLSDDPGPVLEVMVDKKFQRVLVTGCIGMYLECQLPAGGVQMIGAGQCAQPDEFWRLWKHFTKDQYKFEDGTKFDPAK